MHTNVQLEHGELMALHLYIDSSTAMLYWLLTAHRYVVCVHRYKSCQMLIMLLAKTPVTWTSMFC